MKLLRFLTEGRPPTPEEIEETVKVISNNCKPFLKEIKPIGAPLQRGIKSTIIDTYIRRKSRKNRKPKDMELKWHKELDELFLEKFGWRARSGGVFTQVSPKFYSNPYLFFPAGNYKYVWSPKIQDLFREVDSFLLSTGEEPPSRKANIWAQKIISTYISTGLSKAMKTNNEITFKCDAYYLVNRLIWPEIYHGLLK
jgi:hypothetical protein